MIPDQYHVKKQRKFDAANKIWDTLMHQYNVKIDDRSAELQVDTDEYAMAGTNSFLQEYSEYVDLQLRNRIMLKQERQYEEADAIGDELRERFRVKVDDRTKEWLVEEQEKGGLRGVGRRVRNFSMVD